MRVNTTIEIKAPRNDFLMTLILELFNWSSREPSSTIKTSPTVAITGKSEEKSGNSYSRNEVVLFKTHPIRSKSITEGILVFEAVRLNKYAINSKEQKAMMIVSVI